MVQQVAQRAPWPASFQADRPVITAPAETSPSTILNEPAHLR
jgi:hypothetical protein